MRLAISMVAMAILLGTAQRASSQESPAMSMLNVPFPTTGGTQVWTDHRNLYDWRLQHNVVTGHWRLLDPRDIRRAWGQRQDCELQLLEATSHLDPAEAPQHVIVLLHGLMRSKHSMRGLRRRIEACENAPHVISFSYASTRCGIAEHAAALREVVDGLPGRPQLSFVGHSMGNIVVRHAIADWQTGGDPHAVLPRLEHVVMLGPPNHGATIARRLGKLGLFEIVTGQGGMELGANWDDFEQHLAIPPCPFAIVAGDLPPIAHNPLVDGNSDFVVSVEEARLEGATEFHTVKHLHSFLMDQRDVQDIVLRFLGLKVG